MYENPETLAAEGSVAAICEEVWESKMHKLPISYGVDFAAERKGKVRAFVEVKQCHYPFEHIDTYRFALNKLLRGRDLSATTGLPFILVVKFLNGIYYTDPLKYYDHCQMGGRLDRGDVNDFEPQACIPTEAFSLLT